MTSQTYDVEFVIEKKRSGQRVDNPKIYAKARIKSSKESCVDKCSFLRNL